MCKACRQRSIWARIKLLSSITAITSLLQFPEASRSKLSTGNFSEVIHFCIIPFVFSSTWFFMSWSSSKPDAHAYRFVIQFLKIVTASQRQDEYLTLSILKMQIFFHSIFHFPQWISWKQLIKTIIFLLIFSVLWISDSFHTNRAENLPFLRPVWKAQNA